MTDPWPVKGKRIFKADWFKWRCLSLVFGRHQLRISDGSRGQLKCDGTRAETRFRLSTKRTSPFQSAGRQLSRLLAADVCASAVVMLDTPCSEVVWRVLATHSIRQFPLNFPSRASPCAITFQLDSTQLGSPAFRQRLRTSYTKISQITAKFNLEESTKAQRVSTGITLLFL
jgi:hypothetical protein